MHIHIYTHIHTNITDIHTYAHVYIHAFTHIFIYTYIHPEHACVSVYAHTHVCAHSGPKEDVKCLPLLLSLSLSQERDFCWTWAPHFKKVELPASSQAPPVSACHLWGRRHPLLGFLTWVMGIQTRLLMLASARALAFFGAPDFPFLPKSGMPLLTFSSDHLQSQHPSKPLAPGTSSFGSISMLDKLTV